VDDFINIGLMDDFSDRRSARKTVDGKEIIVFKIDGEVIAYENNCPHQHFSVLHQSPVEKGTITCPVHGWVFNLKSGESPTGNGRLRKIPVKTERNSVWVKVADHEQNYTLLE
jgi:nitrite reductase/ring-hydroxylating ferredoxin subunit